MAVTAEKFMDWVESCTFTSQAAKEREERQKLSVLTCEDLAAAIGEFKEQY